MTPKPLTVADLIIALQKLPPHTEIWAYTWHDMRPATVDQITSDEIYGWCIADGRLVLVYDSYVFHADKLDFSHLEVQS